MRVPSFLFLTDALLFSATQHQQRHNHHAAVSSSRLWVSSNSVVDTTESLIRLVQHDDNDDNDDDNVKKDESAILPLLRQLEVDGGAVDNAVAVINDDDDDDTNNDDRFKILTGAYEVAYTKTFQPNENPVGGKWTRSTGLARAFFPTRRRSFQHILPANSTGLGKVVLSLSSEPVNDGGAVLRKQQQQVAVVAEAVNVVSLEAFWGLLRVTVILRGDATPLSANERNDTTVVVQPLTHRAVRAWFDAPRIIFGRNGKLLNVQFGPKSSVLLDTLFVNDRLRLGMGGRSGTRFVFVRCQQDDVEANEYRQLLQLKPLSRSKLLAVLWTASLATIWSVFVSTNTTTTTAASKAVRGVLALLTTSLAMAISFSTGGIERDRNRYEFFSTKAEPNTSSAP